MVLAITAKLLSRNSMLNLIGQAGPLLVGVATIPFIVRALGVERFGLLSIAWVMLEYFIVFDLGLGRATTKYVAEALGHNDKDIMSRLVWTAVLVQIGLGLLGTLGLLAIIPFLTEHFLNVPSALEAESASVFQLVALSLPIVLISGTLTGLLAAAQRFALVNAISAFFNIANLMLSFIGVLWLDWGLTEIIMMMVASRFFALIAYCCLCAHIFPFLKRLPSLHLTELRTLLAFGGWVSVSSIAVPLLLYLDRVVIGASVTMVAVAYYSVPYEIVTRLWIIPASFVGVLFPAFSLLSGQGQQQRLVSLLARSMKWLLLTLGPAVVVIAAFARDILQAWLGSDFAYESTLPLQILALGILTNSLVHIQYAVVQALGRPDLTAKFHLAQLPLHAFLVWWLIGLWGPTGAALAQSLRLSVEAALLLIAACRLAALPYSTLVSNRIVQTFLLFFLFVLLAIGVSHLPLLAWPRFLGLGMIFSAVAATVWRYSLDRQDRDQLAKLFWPVNAG